MTTGVRESSGIRAMLASAALSSATFALVYAATRRDPTMSPLFASFARVLVNALVIVLPALARGEGRRLVGDRSLPLWLRGLFGAISTMLLFLGIAAVGLGEATFLSASSGVFVALFGPLILGQRSPRRTWYAIAGALVGLALLFHPRLDDLHPFGRGAALGSGLFIALTYLMVARAGRKNPTRAVIFYYCAASLVLHLGWFALRGVTLPKSPIVWGLLGIAGLTAGAAQRFMTIAYRRAPAAQVAAAGYVTPVLSMVIGVVAFGSRPDPLAWLGATVVLLSGAVLPLLRRRPEAPIGVPIATRAFTRALTRALPREWSLPEHGSLRALRIDDSR
jgi:drug/metabolite transporter (DMT)-like permease